MASVAPITGVPPRASEFVVNDPSHIADDVMCLVAQARGIVSLSVKSLNGVAAEDNRDALSGAESLLRTAFDKLNAGYPAFCRVKQ